MTADMAFHHVGDWVFWGIVLLAFADTFWRHFVRPRRSLMSSWFDRQLRELSFGLYPLLLLAFLAVIVAVSPFLNWLLGQGFRWYF